MQSKTGNHIFLPHVTAVSRGPKRAAASILPDRTKPTCHPEYVLSTKAGPFQGMKKGSFKVPVNVQISENQLLIQDLRPLPKFLSCTPKFSQVDTGVGRLCHKFLWLWLPCLAGV